MGWLDAIGNRLGLARNADDPEAVSVGDEPAQKPLLPNASQLAGGNPDDFWSPTIENSVQRMVREYLEEQDIANPKAKNLSPQDPFLHFNPSTYGDTRPNAQGTALSYTTLRRMYEVPVIRNIIDTRLVQLQDFCYRQRHKNQSGFRVVMRDFMRPPTAAAVKRAAEIEAWIETCGDPSAQIDPSFPTFVWKVMADSLIYDQACWEILNGKDGRPAAMIPVDAKTIRLAELKPSETEKLQRNIKVGRYMQVFPHGSQDPKDYAQWDSSNFMFGVRRPSTAVERYGYGSPELETLMRPVTQLLQAEMYNAANFTNGVHAAAALVIKSAMSREQFQSMDKQLRQMMAGAHNAHRLAVLQLDPSKDEAAQLMPFSSNNRDMEFSMWVSWLLKVACGAYQMDPAEINYIYGNEGQRSALGNQDPTERIATSRERGLKPLLRALESWLNRSVVWRLDPDFRIEFFGLSDRTPLVESELKIKSLSWRSINEIRAQDDEPPIDHWSCNVPANPLTFQAMAQDRAQKMQEEMQQKMAAAQQQQPEQPEKKEEPTVLSGEELQQLQGGGEQDMTNLPENLPEDMFADEGLSSLPAVELTDEEDKSRATPGFDMKDMEKAMRTVSEMYGLGTGIPRGVSSMTGMGEP